MSPDHPVTVKQNDADIRILANGEVVAESHAALTVLEKGHKPVLYLPPQDVRRDLLQQTSHSTHCPYKGDATYWTVTAGGVAIENAAWSYDDPSPQVAQLKGYFAFHTERVDVQTG